ncbi:MAG: hypothetical protein IID45_04000, partial [Planctomycetes bacterium]|nr:hypothetical protein [Planctomycetota bacterium]
METPTESKSPKDSDRLVVKLTRRRKSRYENAAEIEDLSLSEWVRRILDEAAKKILVSTKTTERDNTRVLDDFSKLKAAIPRSTSPANGDYVLAPVIGRTAAGPAEYWSDLNFTDAGIISSIESRLYDLAGIVPHQSREGTLRRLEKSGILAVSMIQCNAPNE